MNIQITDFNSLEIDPNIDLRVDYGDIDDLANSIQEHGILVPLQGRQEGNGWIISDGHRRYKALAILAEGGIYPKVLIQEEPAGYNKIDRLKDIFIRNSGKNLTLFEEAIVVGNISKSYRLSNTEISKLVQKSLPHIGNCLLLLTATGNTKELIVNNAVAASTVITMLKEATPEEVEQRLIKEDNGEKITAKNLDKPPSTEEKLLRELKDELINNGAGTFPIGIVEGCIDYSKGKIDYIEFSARYLA